MAKSMIKLTPIALALLLAGCGTVGNYVRDFEDPVVTKPQLKEEIKLPDPANGTIAVAVYSFRDMTGQRKASQNIASLSSAVTQGADAYLVKSLQELGGGKWFKVLERGGLDNLVKERQLIRQMRELYQGKDAQPLPPMLFAGMILEGGIIGYDSNTMSGGSGARLLGIGASTEYRQDEVTISLRAVSVATGEVLVAVNTSKTVISFQDKLGVLRFYDAGTRSLELETGSATNESMNKAVQLVIHAAVIEMVREGARKGHWAYKQEPLAVLPKVPEVKTTSTPEVENKKEVTKNELVQKDPTPAAAAKTETLPPEPVKSESSGGDNVKNVAPAGKEKIVISIGKSNVRKSNYSGAEIVAVLEPGQTAKVIEEQNDLYLVELDTGKRGFVAKNVVKK